MGKTTLISQVLAKGATPHLFVSADAIHNIGENWLELQWQAARIKRHASGAGDFILVVDEIQKINNWSEIIKKLWMKILVIGD